MKLSPSDLVGWIIVLGFVVGTITQSQEVLAAGFVIAFFIATITK